MTVQSNTQRGTWSLCMAGEIICLQGDMFHCALASSRFLPPCFSAHSLSITVLWSFLSLPPPLPTCCSAHRCLLPSFLPGWPLRSLSHLLQGTCLPASLMCLLLSSSRSLSFHLGFPLQYERFGYPAASDNLFSLH